MGLLGVVKKKSDDNVKAAGAFAGMMYELDKANRAHGGKGITTFTCPHNCKVTRDDGAEARFTQVEKKGSDYKCPKCGSTLVSS